MKICWCVCTYLRPVQLGWIVYMFQQQTHEDVCMVILDDADQLSPQTGERWELFTAMERYASLGEKRNACMQLADATFSPDAYAVIDDDDLYFPWHTELGALALAQADWSMPSRVLHMNPDHTFRQHLTGPGTFYHGGMMFRRDVFWKAGGYPSWSGPEDQGLFRRLEAVKATSVDPLTLSDKPVSYVWLGDVRQQIPHISGYLGHGDHGEFAWKQLEKCMERKERAELKVTPPPIINLYHPVIHPQIHKRPF